MGCGKLAFSVGPAASGLGSGSRGLGVRGLGGLGFSMFDAFPDCIMRFSSSDLVGVLSFEALSLPALSSTGC